MMESRACQELENRVIKQGLCTLCGACVGMCPYFVAYKGRVILKDVCELSQGRCQAFCPRTSIDLNSISQAVFGVPYAWDELGTVQQVFMARSTDAKTKAWAQDGGFVTALTCFALDEGVIDSAVLTLFEDKSLPEGVVASNRDEVLKCAGSSYMAAPTIEAFNRAIQGEGQKSIGVVGTPCQVLALARMRATPPEICKDINKLKLVIGLFCTWALSYPDFARFLESEVSGSIVKYVIPPHPANILVVYTERERIEILLDDVLPFVQSACHVCPDLTAEFADISVGGGRREVLDWNTVIVRSERGRQLIDSAIKKGIIETTAIPERNLRHLKEAAENKKKRALRNIIQKTGSVDNLLYLTVQPGVIKHLVEEGMERRQEDA